MITESSSDPKSETESYHVLDLHCHFTFPVGKRTRVSPDLINRCIARDVVDMRVLSACILKTDEPVVPVIQVFPPVSRA